MAEVDLLHLLIRYLGTLGVVLGVQTGTYAQAAAGVCGANVVQNGFVVSQGLGRPVLADEREHPVFDGVPLRGTRRVVGDAHAHAEAVAEGVLQLVLPETRAVSIASAAVGKDEQTMGARILSCAELGPPRTDGIDCELRGVAGRADRNKSLVPEGVIDAVGYRNPVGIRRDRKSTRLNSSHYS